MDIRSLRQKLIARSHRFGPALAIALLAGTLGIFSLQASHAATFASVSEAESGAKTGNYASGDPAGASANASVKFGSITNPTPPPPPPPGGLNGWQLTPQNTGLSGVGLNCNNLAAYTGTSKPPAGTTITEKRITTPLNLSNGNITIERSCIRPTSIIVQALVTSTDYDRCTNTCPVTTGTITIRDSDIDGSNVGAEEVSKACAFIGVGILERNYMHDMGSGICFFNTGDQLDASAVGNYVYHLRAFGNAATTGSHNESFTVRDFDTKSRPARRMTVANNRLDSSSGNDTGAFFIQTYGGYIDQVLAQNNLLEGGGYQLILETNGGNTYGPNLKAINNRFSGTGYGPGYVTGGPGWAQWTDNYINDPTKADNKGRVVNEP